ncbi:MAG: YtxH domain-containing protein [Gemmatimonadetes bacterium]|nr:YtxH domain-containing protein [Gemmatimonadota bacterium]
MYYEDRSSGVSFLAGLVLGAVVGAGVALLVAPQSGKRTRRQIARAATKTRDTAMHRWGDLSDDVRGVVRSGRRRLHL